MAGSHRRNIVLVSVHVHGHGKWTLDPLELEFQVFVSPLTRLPGTQSVLRKSSPLSLTAELLFQPLDYCYPRLSPLLQ